MTGLWQQLSDAQLVTGPVPPPANPGPAWYVAAMLGIAAWIAAIFLTIAIVVFFDGVHAMGIAGGLACAAGLALLRFPNPFVTQLGLAASIAGQAGMFLGLGGWLQGYHLPAAIMAVVLIGPSLLTTNAFYRIWCTAASLLLLAVSLDQWGAITVGIAAAIVTAVFVVWPQVPRAYGYGAAIALIAIDALSIFGRNAPLAAGYAAGVLAGAALVYTAYRLLGTTRAALYTALVACVVIPVSGLAAALLIVLIGFGRGAPVLLGLGVAAGLGYLSHYYYALSLTLLVKSVALTATGVLLLLLRWILFRKEPS